MSRVIGSAVGALAIGLALACSAPADGPVGSTPAATGGSDPAGPPGTGGSTAQAGASSGGSGQSAAAAGNGGAGAAPECPESVGAEPSSMLLHLPIELVAGSAPFSLNQEHALDGNAYVASEFSFFLSSATLIRRDGGTVPARFADPSGAPRPYDVHLIRASDPASLSLDLLAPAGDYDSLVIGVGVPVNCNRGDPTRAVYPLNASSGMYWIWGTGYMFIRLEGSRLSAGTSTPFAYHVGFDPAYRTLTLTTPLTIPLALPRRLVLDVTRVMSSTTVTSGGMHSLPDIEVADRFAAPGTLVLEP